MSKEKEPKIVPSPEFIQMHLKYLRDMTAGIVNTKLQYLCRKVLDDKRFQSCTAAKAKHQAYEGGLVVHTSEVLAAALQMATCRRLKVNYDILVTAAIFHDYGKIWDYKILVEPQGMPGMNPGEMTLKYSYEYTSHQKLIRHLPRSYAEFLKMEAMTQGAPGESISDDILQQISHCILSHHGRKEWGSPVEPETTEAHIIHYADMLSANCGLESYNV